jgi:hypothetical protein
VKTKRTELRAWPPPENPDPVRLRGEKGGAAVVERLVRAIGFVDAASTVNWNGICCPASDAVIT